MLNQIIIGYSVVHIFSHLNINIKYMLNDKIQLTFFACNRM